MIKSKNNRVWLLKLLAICAMLFVLPAQSYAADITLEWDANTESDLAGYRVYYKMDSSGDRILDNYKGGGLVLLEESGTTRVVNSGFEISGVSCHLSGLDGGIIYFFIVTAFNIKGEESSASREVSTDAIPPTEPVVLSGTQVPGERQVSFEWSPSTDPMPGSGMAEYSYVLDAYPNTIPDPTPNLGLVASGTFYVPFDGPYWFHIRGVDKAGLAGPNASETEHYGPICVDTGPPVVDYAYIDYVSKTLYVIYSETHMQHVAEQRYYSFDNGLLLIDDGTDVYDDGMVFSFLLDPLNLDRYLIYTMIIAEDVADCASNPIPVEQRTITINDDDHDGMADEWERLWFGDTWSKDGSEDSDGDGVLDLDEYSYAIAHPELGTNRWTLSPLDPDSDHDGIPDGYEILPEHGLNPTDPSDGPANYQGYLDSIVAPVIEPIDGDWSGEWTSYMRPPPSLSLGSLPVTWSLVSPPPGMDIDSITGEVFWANPILDGSPYTITVRAENWTNPGLYAEKTWLLTVIPYQITVYMNALTGDDVSGDGSVASPWKSIGFALSETQGSLSPLVTIGVSAGRYLENIIIPRSGIELEGGWSGDFSQRWDFAQSGVEPSSEYETIIDGQNSGTVIVAGSDTTIDGFAITGGNGTNGGGISGGDGLTVSNCKIYGNSAIMGGGIYLGTGSVTGCLFLNNSAEFGGGIYTRDGNPWTLDISGCTFTGNSADTGGGIYNINCSPTIENCLFVDNTSLGAQPGPAGGGGIANESSSPAIVNCTFFGNMAAEYGGAIGNFVDSIPILVNSILWGNAAGVSGGEIHNASGGTAYISYCDIQGSGGSGSTWDSQFGEDGGGNIDADPLFVYPLNHDYHLQHLSPCIDAGDPYWDYSMEPEPNGGRINMGAYGGTSEATTTLPVITGVSHALSTLEDKALTITLADLTVSDPDNTYPTGFTLAVKDGSNYSRVGNTITPVLNFNGTLSVPVTVNDGTVNSPEFLLAVEVLRDSDNDGMPDIWENAKGLDPLDPFDAALDKDGDGYSNLSEYTARTDPGDPASHPLTTFLVEHITVTDVTPDGFSVIWQSSEPGTCSLAVYDGTGAPLSGIEVVSESALHPPAEDIGVMKVRVSGLEAGTKYFFQTLTISKVDGLAVFAPYPGVLEVVTESATTPVNNDLFKQKIYDEQENPAEGALLVASVSGGDYPVSGWVVQGVEGPWATVDLNGVYSETSHQNLQLVGGEELTLWSFGGQKGHYVNVQEIPVPSGVEEAAVPAASYLSRETGRNLDLKMDLNIVGIPVYSTPEFTAHSLLLYLKQQAGGNSSAIQNIKRYNTEKGSWETASWFNGNPAGPNFPIKAGEAYLIYMGQDMNGVWFEGVACGAAVQLEPGLNLASLPSLGQGFQYTSYDMLEDLGNETQVTSTRRYDNTQGWQTTSWFMGSVSGVEFKTSTGEGYLIYMKEEKWNWRAY